jgi:hypothetical protein
LFIAKLLDSLWKSILLKFDDILLFQKDIIKDQIRLNSSYLTFDKKRFELTIADLQKEISQLKEDHAGVINNYEQKLKHAYEEKDRIGEVVKELRAEYTLLTTPGQRNELISDVVKNYKNISELLETVEIEKDVQYKAVSNLVGMYDLRKIEKEGNRQDIGVATEMSREEAEKLLLKSPY